MAQCTSCWRRSFHWCRSAVHHRAIHDDVPFQRTSCVHRFPFGTALRIAITAGINYRPYRMCLPSLIVVGVVNFLFDLARARFPAGRMTRRYRRNCRSATEFCTSHRRKLTFARLTAIISQNSRTVYYRINIYYRLIKIARCDCHHHKYTIGRKTKIKKNILMSTRMMSGMTYCHPLQLFELDTENFFLSSYTTILHIIFLLYMYICRRKSPIMR